MIGRRVFILGAAALAATAQAIPVQPSPEKFERIRARLGVEARLGVAIRDTLTGDTVGFDMDSRYPIASTFKFPLVAAILADAERGAVSLGTDVPIVQSDLADHAPVVRRRLRRGRMSIRELCVAALTHADNSAANLLLRELGGPEAFNAFVRRCGDDVTTLGSYEPQVNLARPGDERDTTSPAAMAALVDELILGDVLSHDSEARLRLFARDTQRLRDRLPADMPPNGTPEVRRASGEVVVDWPLEHERVIVASYVVARDASLRAIEAAHFAAMRAARESLVLPARNRDPLP